MAPPASFGDTAFPALFDQNPLPVVICNQAREVVAWNRAATHTFGFGAAEALGKPALRLIVPEAVRDFVDETWSGLVAGRPAVRVTHANVTRDGRTILCEWNLTALVDAGGTATGVLAIGADVTERERERDALKRSEMRFRSLIELTRDGISVTRDGRFVYANPAFASFLGYASPEEVLALTNTREVLAPDQHEKAETHLAQLRRQRFIPPTEYSLRRKDGSVVHCELMATLIDFEGEVSTLSTLRDLTERRQMQARLLQSDRMASVGTLAAGVAHEINNPIAYMKANLDVLTGRLLPDLSRRLGAVDGELVALPEVRERLDVGADFFATRAREMSSMIAIIYEGAERVRGIVRDLKTFSRADGSSVAPVDVVRVLDASINLAWNEIRHRATLIRQYGDVPPVVANESRLGQVFLNLLLNAAQAIPSGEPDKHEIRVASRAVEGGRVTVTVTDTGVGIRPDALDRIFDPFFTTKPEGVGTGLGLWVCQGIITSLGGEIRVSSEEGVGTSITVTVPSRYLMDEPVTAVRRGRILVVDEEPALGSALSIALYAEHDVVAATSGKSAIRLLQRQGLFDVIFCEAELRDMTGLDVYRAVTRENGALAPRFVFAVGHGTSPEVRGELGELPNLLVTKPFDVARLTGVVRRQIEQTRPSLLPPR